MRPTTEHIAADLRSFSLKFFLNGLIFEFLQIGETLKLVLQGVRETLKLVLHYLFGVTTPQ